MGGGTLLIPLLTLCASVEQHLAQSINLIAFIPMSIVALSVHIKNGYVDYKAVPIVIALALVSAIACSYGAKWAGSYALKASFGAFLIALGVYRVVKTTVDVVKSKRQKERELKTLLSK